MVGSNNSLKDVQKTKPGEESGSSSSGFSRMLECLGIGVPSPNDTKEWPQVVVSCWKYDIDSVKTHQREDDSETKVVLGASWGQDNHVPIYRNENDESELKGCTRDGIALDWGKMFIRLPESRFLEMDEFVSASSALELNSDQLTKTSFTFENKLGGWDYDWAFRVLVYCYKKGSDGKAMLLFGSDVQSTSDSKATLSMVPNSQSLMKAHCEGGKFLVDVWRWNSVYGTFEFTELKDEEHLPVK